MKTKTKVLIGVAVVIVFAVMTLIGNSEFKAMKTVPTTTLPGPSYTQAQVDDADRTVCLLYQQGYTYGQITAQAAEQGQSYDNGSLLGMGLVQAAVDCPYAHGRD